MTSVLPKPDIESSIWIARSAEDIWNYLYDVSNDSQWRGGVSAAQWISDPPHGIGSTGLHVVQGIGNWPRKVTVWKEPGIMSWDVTGGKFEGAHAGYRIVPEDGGSRVTLHISVKPNAIVRIIMLIMKRRMRRQLAPDLEKLKAIMEA